MVPAIPSLLLLTDVVAGMVTGYRDHTMRGEPIYRVPLSSASFFPQTPGMAIRWPDGRVEFLATTSGRSSRSTDPIKCDERNSAKTPPLTYSEIEVFLNAPAWGSSSASIWSRCGGPQLVHNLMCLSSQISVDSLRSLFLIVSHLEGFRHDDFGLSILSQSHQVCSRHKRAIVAYLQKEYRDDWKQRSFVQYFSRPKTTAWNMHLVCPSASRDPIVLRFIVLQRFVRAVRHRYQFHSPTLTFDRRRILQQSADTFGNLGTDWSRKLFYVRLQGEEAIDSGGVVAEFMALFGRALIEEKFVESTSGGFMTVSGKKSNDGVYVAFGRLLAFSLIFDTYLGIPISLGLVKFLLNEKVTLDDLKQEDPEMYRQINRSGSELESLELVFTATDANGKEHELVRGGAGIAVSRKNADQWKERMAWWQLMGKMEKGFKAIRAGFSSILSIDEIFRNMHAKYLAKVFSGGTVPSKDDFKQMIEFSFGERINTNGRTQLVSNFWAMIDALSDTQRMKLVTFATASPVVDFRKIYIYFEDFSTRYPRAGNHGSFPEPHTCTRTIDVPLYTSLEQMKTKFAIALQHGSDNVGRH